MKALKLAILKQMTDDTEYLALMGAPSLYPYNTYFLECPNEPTFPETVFDFASVNYDTSNGAINTSAEITLNINVWTVDADYEDIIDRIKVLFHHKTIGTTGAHAILLREPQDRKDEKFNVYGKVVSFAVYYRRSIYE